MFGKILEIDEKNVIIENLKKETHSEFMNCHIIFEEPSKKTVGEIVKMDDDYINVLLIGEIENNIFSAGVVKKPATNSIIRIINVSELSLIIGKNEPSKDSLIIGKSAIYKSYNISIPINSFFANHSCIIGNTGSGKSCSVSRILENLFVDSPFKPKNSHFVVFDAYGEYKNSFMEINKVPGLGFKKYTTKVESDDELLLKIPPYFLGPDDLAILLSATDSTQLPVIEKTLKLVYIFTSKDDTMKEYKNDIIAKCLLDILTSGKSGSQMRDQIIAVLSHYNTEDLNLESIIKQPGYDRTLKQCLLIDEQGKMNAILLVTEFLHKFEKVNLDNIVIGDGFIYNLNDLYYALEFALISEGTLNSNDQYNKNNILKTRLQSIINSDNKEIFQINEYVDRDIYIDKLFKDACLIDINLSHVDDRFAKIITKLLSKILFTYTTKQSVRGSISMNIILEEAHRYVQNDSDVDIIGYNIFDRITKEGRKYGTLLTFITQRPSELSTTALSQCSNFIVFRLYHPNDFDIVSNLSTNVNNETLEKLKSLNPGTALVFGTGFKVPLLAKFELPNVMPESTSVDLAKLWYTTSE